MADESWKLPSPIPSSGDLTNSCENPLDFTCEDLKGRATGIFLPLDREDVLVKEGACTIATAEYPVIPRVSRTAVCLCGCVCACRNSCVNSEKYR